MSGRVDTGRLVVLPCAAVLLINDVIALTRGTLTGGAGALQCVDAALVAAFYALVIWCYLRRGPAGATSGSITGHLAAVMATCAPFAFPLLPATTAGSSQQVLALLPLTAGTGWSLWALRALGRNLSVLAQARDVVERGPYRWVRHPLYTGELVSSLGLAITVGTVTAAAVWLALFGLQVYRALREEQLLRRALPGYDGYRHRTAALLPGLF